MKRGVALGIIAVVAVMALVGVFIFGNRDTGTKTANTATTSTETTTADTNTTKDTNTEQSASNSLSRSITIEDFAFSPATISVKKGTKVSWTNKDEVKHDVTPDSGNAVFQGSELLGKGESYSWTFDTVGTYTYHCSPHPNMKASVVVTE